MRRRFFRRPHGRSHVHPQERFSHSPPGHTCGLPCCQEDAPIPLRVPAHVDRYRCIPVASGEMTVAHNFTLRKQRLLQDRPSLSAKFFSLQTPRGVRGKARMMLPTFRDDSEVSTAENNNLRHSTFLRPSAVFETGGISHFLSPPSPGCAAVVARGRYLWPWERFISREIALPDTPSGSRRMVALDFQPGDSHDDSDTEDSDIASTACQEDASSATSALEKPESSKVKGVFHEQNSCANDRDDKCVAGDKSCDDMLSNLPVGDRKCGDQLRTYVSDDDDVNSEDEKLDDINIEDKCRDDGVGSDIVSDHVYNEVDDDSLCRSWLQDQVAITNLRNKWPTVNRTLSLEDFAILSRADSLSKMETLSSRNALTPEAKHLLISLYRAGEGEEARYSTFPTRCKPHHTYETLKTTAGRTAAAHSSPPLLPPRRNSSGLVGGHRTGRIGQMDRVGGHDWLYEMVSLLPPEHRAGACSLVTDTRLLGHLSTPACEDIWIRRQTLEKKGDEVTYLEREGEETALTGGIREADVVTSVESKDVAGLLVRLRCLPESPVTLIL